MLRLDFGEANSLFERAFKAFGKRIDRGDLTAYVNQMMKEELPQTVKYTTQWIEKALDKDYIEKWKKQEVAGNLRRNYENDHVDQQLTKLAWKNLNIKKSAYIQVVRMQEGSTFNGVKRAQLSGIPEKKYCKICKHRVATNPHILLSCPVNKKKQIAKHDYLDEAVYHELEKEAGFPRRPQIKHFRKKKYAILTWNKEVVSRSYGKFPKKPDIYYRLGWYAVVIDIAIVADHNLNKGYCHKCNAYTKLCNLLREKLKITHIKLIPVIISINGLINKHSVEDLKEINISINWEKVVRDIVIRNMQDTMYYNGINMEASEIMVEDGNEEGDD